MLTNYNNCIYPFLSYYTNTEQLPELRLAFPVLLQHRTIQLCDCMCPILSYCVVSEKLDTNVLTISNKKGATTPPTRAAVFAHPVAKLLMKITMMTRALMTACNNTTNGINDFNGDIHDDSDDDDDDDDDNDDNDDDGIDVGDFLLVA